MTYVYIISVIFKNLVAYLTSVLLDPLHQHVNHPVLHWLLVLTPPPPPPPPRLLQRDRPEQHSSSDRNRCRCSKQRSVLIHLQNGKITLACGWYPPPPDRSRGGRSWHLTHLQNHRHHSKGLSPIYNNTNWYLSTCKNTRIIHLSSEDSVWVFKLPSDETSHVAVELGAPLPGQYTRSRQSSHPPCCLLAVTSPSTSSTSPAILHRFAKSGQWDPCLANIENGHWIHIISVFPGFAFFHLVSKLNALVVLKRLILHRGFTQEQR